MRFRCPVCSASYEMDYEALLEADGRTQCLHCGTVFDAVTEQAEDDGASTDRPPPLRPDKGSMVAPEPETHNDQPLPFAIPDDLPPLEPAAEGALDVVDTLYEKPTRRGLIYGTLAALLIGALALQLAWQHRADLLQQFPHLEVVCSYLPCRPEVVHEPDKYRVMQRDIAPTKNVPGSLTLKATIRNDAEIAQHLPDIQLSLIDNNGAPLIRRRLSPHEYLYPPPPENRVLEPGEVFTIEIDFEDPGHIASGFTIDFF